MQRRKWCLIQWYCKYLEQDFRLSMANFNYPQTVLVEALSTVASLRVAIAVTKVVHLVNTRQHNHLFTACQPPHSIIAEATEASEQNYQLRLPFKFIISFTTNNRTTFPIFEPSTQNPIVKFVLRHSQANYQLQCKPLRILTRRDSFRVHLTTGESHRYSPIWQTTIRLGSILIRNR